MQFGREGCISKCDMIIDGIEVTGLEVMSLKGVRQRQAGGDKRKLVSD